jgi:hypothetical protein
MSKPCNHMICKELHKKKHVFGKNKYNGAGVIIGTIKEGKVNVLLGFENSKPNKKEYELWKSNTVNKTKNKYNGKPSGAFTFFSGSYEEKSLYNPECYIETARRELEEEAKLIFNLDTFTQKINDGTPQLNGTSGGAVFLAPIPYDDTENLNVFVENAFADTTLPTHQREMSRLEYFCIEDKDEIEENKNTMYTWAYNIISENKQKIIDTVKQKLNSTTAPVEQVTKPDTTNANSVTKQDTTTTTEGTILYVDTKSSNPNMMVSMIKLNDNFKKYTKKNGTWIEDTSKGGNKRKSKPTKKARRSK